MDQKYLLHCVLMSVLLIFIDGNQTSLNITCLNQTGIVGKSLNVTCNINCQSCDYKEHYFKHNDTKRENKMYPVDGNRMYYYTIANATVNDSGNYTFWVQMANGQDNRTFTVTIASAAIPLKTDVSQPTKVKVASAVVLLCSFITVIIGVCACRMRKKRVQYYSSCVEQLC